MHSVLEDKNVQTAFKAVVFEQNKGILGPKTKHLGHFSIKISNKSLEISAWSYVLPNDNIINKEYTKYSGKW